MGKPKIRYDMILFALLMALLFVPLLQEHTGLFNVKPLKGVFEPTPKPELTFDNYRTSTYQTQIEKYASENFGMREPIIRIYNQYLWTAFNKTYCHFIVPGKDGYLFYAQAVNEHFGTELLKHYKSNEEAMKDVETELRQMNKVRHVLKDYGIEFLAFIAPDKPEVYPEYLPRRDADTTTLHLTDYFAKRMTETGFPFIDMTDWFVQMRDTATFPIFPKTDSHWRYAATYGYDSLFRFINTLGGEAKFPEIRIGAPIAYESDKLEGDEETLNLLFRISGDRTKYKSDVTVIDTATRRKPKVLFVGDSFIWSMNEFLPTKKLMADKEIWFYNNTAFEGFENKKENVKDIDRLKHILNADYVVYYSAGHQWWEATYGFAKDALMQLCVSDSLFEATVADRMDRLRHTKGYEDMTDDELRANITWMLNNDPELIPGLEGEAMPTIRNTKRIEAALNEISLTQTTNGIVTDTAAFIRAKKDEMIEAWRNYPEQMEMIRKKARERGLPIDTILEKDAQWVIKQQIENGELFN